MITGKTTSGYEFKIQDNVKSDWRFVRKLAELSELENEMDEEMAGLEFVKIMSGLEGIIFKDKGKGLENHIAKMHNGQVPADVLLAEILEVIKYDPEIKN